MTGHEIAMLVWVSALLIMLASAITYEHTSGKALRRAITDKIRARHKGCKRQKNGYIDHYFPYTDPRSMCVCGTLYYNDITQPTER